MFDILHRIGVIAPVSDVYRQLATIEGLAAWWTSETTGSAALGEQVTFRFGADDRIVVMEVTEALPDRRIAWRCVDGPSEWIGTDFTFDLREGDGETVVMFANTGWREPVEFMHHCTSKWGTFLMSLKHSVETGTGAPFPNDVLIGASG